MDVVYAGSIPVLHPMNRVFIRKYGIFSSLGRNAEEVEDNLFKGKVAIKSDPDRSYFMSSLCGDVPFIDNERGLSQAATYAMQTIREIGPLPKNDIGMIYGCDSSTQAVIDCYETLKDKGETRRLSPEHTFKSLNSNITMNLAYRLGIDKLSLTLSSACSSAAHAIGVGFFLIKHGMMKHALVGGAQETTPYSLSSFDALRVFSKKASLPFSKDRSGLVPSGGAASLLLTSEESEENIAEILGWNFSTNKQRVNPSLDREIDCMCVWPTPNYINAHATGTLLGDETEAKAIFTIFGNIPYVTSTKCYTGHELWMAGASDLIYTLMMMKRGTIMPQLGDIENFGIRIPTKVVHTSIDLAISNSFGFGGTNCSLLIRNL